MAVFDPRPVPPPPLPRDPAMADPPPVGAPPPAAPPLVDPPLVGAPPPRRPAPLPPEMAEEPMRPLETRLRLPAHRNKVERVADHTTGIFDDVKEWVELRIKIVRSEIEALIDSRILALRGQIIFGVAAAITALYFLVTLAVLIGAATGGRYWIGFLVVNLILAGGTWWAKRTFAPGKMHVERSKATGQVKISHEHTPAQKEAKDKGDPVPDHGELSASNKPSAQA